MISAGWRANHGCKLALRIGAMALLHRVVQVGEVRRIDGSVGRDDPVHVVRKERHQLQAERPDVLCL